MPKPYWAALLCFVALLALLRAAGNAHAMFCAPTTQITDRLQSEYKEQRIGVGTIKSEGSKVVVELFVGADSWTLLTTTAGKMSCIRAAGKGWITHTPKPLKKGDPL